MVPGRGDGLVAQGVAGLSIDDDEKHMTRGVQHDMNVLLKTFRILEGLGLAF